MILLCVGFLEHLPSVTLRCTSENKLAGIKCEPLPSQEVASWICDNFHTRRRCLNRDHRTSFLDNLSQTPNRDECGIANRIREGGTRHLACYYAKF
jgi:hypothetical protein